MARVFRAVRRAPKRRPKYRTGRRPQRRAYARKRTVARPRRSLYRRGSRAQMADTKYRATGGRSASAIYAGRRALLGKRKYDFPRGPPRTVGGADGLGWVVAVGNPFDARLKGSAMAPRIADGTANETFMLEQQGSASWIMPQGADTSANSTFIGFAMRPSMNDSAITFSGGTYVPGAPPSSCDAFLGMYNVDNVDGREWAYGDVTSWANGAATTTTGYYWGNGSTAVNNLLPSWAHGTEVFAVQNGSRCRPTAWGIRIKAIGIASPTQQNVDPAGFVYFGVRTSAHGDDMSTQATASGLVGATQVASIMDTQFFYDSGPTTQISYSALNVQAQRQQVGRLSYSDLSALKDGLVVSTGPVGIDERNFRDITYFTGSQRCAYQSVDSMADTATGGFSFAGNIPPNYFDMVGSNPWFFISGMPGVQFQIDTICWWEVLPQQQAQMVLPVGMFKTARKNEVALEAGVGVIRGMRDNPNRAARITGGVCDVC